MANQTTNAVNHLYTLQSIKSIYYNLSNHQQLEVMLNESEKLPNQNLKFYSRGAPCECQHLTCSCCTGMKLGPVDFNKTCAKVVVLPEEFSMQIFLMMDEKVLATQTFSGKNPRPICYPINFSVVPLFKLCIRFYDIHIINDTFIACADFESKVDNWSMFILHFDCMQMSMINGTSISWIDHSDTIQSINSDALIDNLSLTQFITSEEPEVFDEVTFEPAFVETISENSTPKILSEEEEDQIGTLKI
ncbi:hypothetical protein PV325_013842 [Microctonus aethiopoides]|nr:hypothetical protein PV325_013842 [Microctonus aethiopoides]KAK0083335.1 hypothetical protein PV326_006770 [Microctonus aethiopoides]